MRWPNLSLSVPDAPPAPIHALRSLAVFAEAPSDEHTRIGAALGFDVVPSDCLLAHAASRLPCATVLRLAIAMPAVPSRGTAKTAVESIAR